MRQSRSVRLTTCLAWARDEPPSPGDEVPSSVHRDHISVDERPSTHRPSDVTSYQSSVMNEDNAGPSRWWAFTRHRPEDSSASQPLAPNASRHGTGRDRSLSVAWLAASLSRRPGESNEANGNAKDRDIEPTHVGTDFRSAAISQDRLRLDLPPQQSPITLAQTRTPGWETPWTPRAPGVSWNVDIDESDGRDEDREKLSRWQTRKKRIRVYMLTNTYVPLVRFRMGVAVMSLAYAQGFSCFVSLTSPSQPLLSPSAFGYG